MFDLKTVSLFSFILIIKGIDCQSLLGGRQSPLDKLPGVGACDRIASRGVGNCMENFLPTNVLSGFTGGPRGGGSGGDLCCSYSKYRACINGLHTGLRIAMERERCPKSYSAKIIKSMGDSFVGLPLKSYCGNGSRGRSQCPKSGNNKPKKNQKQPKRTPERTDTIGGSGGGIGGIGDTIGGVFGRGTGTRQNNNPIGGIGDTFGGGGGIGGIGDTIGGVFGRGSGSRQNDNPIGGIGDTIGGVFGRGSGGRQNDNPIGGIGDAIGGVFGRGTGSRRDNRDRDNPSILSPIGDVFNKGRETVEQGASSVIGGLQSAFGGLGNIGQNSNL